MSNIKLSDPISQDVITLQKIRKGMSMKLGSTLIDSMQINVQDFIGERIVSAFCDVLADKIAEDTYPAYFSYKVPTTTWQMFKKLNMPKWFTKRYPVVYDTKRIKRTVKLTRMAEYPRANIAIPKDSPVFIKSLGSLEVIRDTVEQL